MQRGRVVEQALCEELFRSPKHPYTPGTARGRAQRWAGGGRAGGTAARGRGSARLVPDQEGPAAAYRRSHQGRRRRELQPAPGQTLGIVGESGSGKSTLGLAILRLLASRGEIRFRGQQLQGMSQRAVRPLRRQMQVVFRDPYGSLSPRMSVGQIIEKGCAFTTWVMRRSRNRQSLTRSWRLVSIRKPASLPPRVFRRATATHCHCPGSGVEAGADTARRADLGARSHGTASGGGAPALVAGQVQPDLPVHQP